MLLLLSALVVLAAGMGRHADRAVDTVAWANGQIETNNMPHLLPRRCIEWVASSIPGQSRIDDEVVKRATWKR